MCAPCTAHGDIQGIRDAVNSLLFESEMDALHEEEHQPIKLLRTTGWLRSSNRKPRA